MSAAEPSAPLRRFYADASSAPAEAGGFAVLLDGRTVRTPAKAALLAPTAALGRAIAAEWAGQGEAIQPGTMPLTRLANVAIDRTPRTRADIAEMIASYAETDLLCHRAEAPVALVRRQAQAWDPPLEWAARSEGVRLVAVAGVMATEQDVASLERVRQAALALDDFALTGFAHGVGLTGSAILGLALVRGAAPQGQALFEAAALDELWSLETWGQDGELAARVERVRGELAALEAWFLALKGE